MGDGACVHVHVVRFLKQSWSSIVVLARSPGKLVMLFGGSAGVTLAYIAALAAAVAAFNGDVSFAQVGAVYLGASLVAAAAPTPGGLGAIEAALVAGLTGVGMEPGPAVAAVLELPPGDLLAADPARLDQLPAPRAPQLHLDLRHERPFERSDRMGDNPNETRQTLEMTTDVARRSTRRGSRSPSAVALAVLVVTTLIVRSGKVSQLEKDVFHIINGLPNFLRPIMYVFQLAGLLFVPLLVAIGAAICRKWWLALCLVLAVPVKLFFEHEVIKKLVDRQRPGTSICHGDPTCGHFRSVPLHGESYVSGHTIITGLVATLLFGYLNRTGRIVVVAIALLNGVARVYLGAHNPLDIVGGLALGVCIGCLLLFIIEPLWRDARHRARRNEAPSPAPESV